MKNTEKILEPIQSPKANFNFEEIAKAGELLCDYSFVYQVNSSDNNQFSIKYRNNSSNSFLIDQIISSFFPNNALGFVHPADREKIRQRFFCMTDGSVFQGKFRIKAESGEYTDYFEIIVPLTNLAADIKEFKVLVYLNTQILSRRIAIEMITAAIESNMGLLILDQKARIQFSNSIFSEFTGFNSERLKGFSVFDFLTPLPQKQELDELSRKLNAGLLLSRMFILKTLNNNFITSFFTIVPFKTNHSEAPLYVIFGYSHVVGNGRPGNAEIHYSNIDNIIFRVKSISHDLKSIFNMVAKVNIGSINSSNNAIFTKENVSTTANLFQYYTELLMCLDNIDKEPNNLNNILNISALVHETCIMIKYMMPEKIRFHWNIISGGQIIGSSIAIKQAIINLIQNSMAAIHGKGRLTVEVDCSIAETKCKIHNSTGFYKVVIKDTGQGISDEYSKALQSDKPWPEHLRLSHRLSGLEIVHHIVYSDRKSVV